MSPASASPESQPVSTVSPRAAEALTDAMARLLAGRPLRTDGRLVKENLCKEAGVSCATMNRAIAILDNSALRDELTRHRGATVMPFPTRTGKSQL